MPKHVVVAVLLFTLTAHTHAARPAAELLPATTKGFVSVPDVDALRTAFDKTQIGQLLADKAMEEFVASVREQIQERLDKTRDRLGITWEDIEGVYGGEVAVAVIQPWDEAASQARIDKFVAQAVAKAESDNLDEAEVEAARLKALTEISRDEATERLKHRATVMLADVTGKLDEAHELLGKVEKGLLKRGGRKSSQTIEGVEMTVITMPAKEGQAPSKRFYAIHNDQLVGADRADIVAGVLRRFEGDHEDTLAKSAPFAAAMDRAAQAFGDTAPHIRWFIEPFGFTEANRSYAGGRRARGTDMLRVLGNQGFKAIQGIGGFVALSTEKYDARHHTLVYAPPVKREAGDDSEDKYDLAARMLDFPNNPVVNKPQPWVPRELATHVTFNWRAKNAFWNAESLVNELAGDDVFDDVIESIELDPHGPQINVDKELVQHLGERATLISDYIEPINPDSERMLFALEVTDPQTVAATLNKAMEIDPNARKREFNGHIVWEMVEEAQDDDGKLEIDFGQGFGGPEFDVEEEEEEDKPFLPNSAMTVAHGHLILGSDVQFMAEILKQRNEKDYLGDAVDFKLVSKALTDLGANGDSFRFFTRTDEAYRVTYELLRQGKMPESKSMLGKMLNRALTSEDDEELREQQLDPEKMPPYQLVRRFLGPAGAFVRTEQDGWVVQGCLLSKDAK